MSVVLQEWSGWCRSGGSDKIYFATEFNAPTPSGRICTYTLKMWKARHVSKWNTKIEFGAQVSSIRAEKGGRYNEQFLIKDKFDSEIYSRTVINQYRKTVNPSGPKPTVEKQKMDGEFYLIVFPFQSEFLDKCGFDPNIEYWCKEAYDVERNNYTIMNNQGMWIPKKTITDVIMPVMEMVEES